MIFRSLLKVWSNQRSSDSVSADTELADAAKLFWLSDEQWARIEPHLPTDVRGNGRWLGWLSDTDPLPQATPPASLVSRAHVENYITYLNASCHSHAVRSYIQDLYNAVRVLAPANDWRWLSELVKTLRSRAMSVRDKRPLLRSPVSLIALGDRMMCEAREQRGWSDRRRAVHFRDGLLIAFLASRPVRARNLASMRIGRQLLERGNRFWVVFEADETKHRKPYEAILPDSLVPHLRQYLDTYRPILLRGETLSEPASIDALWVSEIGTYLTQIALSIRICKHTKAAFGHAMSPHLFRDSVATEIAIHNPRHVDDAARLLGHATLATTERHYILASTLVASRRYGDVVLAFGGPEGQCGRNDHPPKRSEP